MCYTIYGLVTDSEGEVQALVGASKVKVMELETPVCSEGEIGDDIVANTGTKTHKICGFVLKGGGLFDSR